MNKVLQITVEHYLTFAGQKSYTIFTPFKHCKKYIMNLSIWCVHWDDAKKFQHFLKFALDPTSQNHSHIKMSVCYQSSLGLKPYFFSTFTDLLKP